MVHDLRMLVLVIRQCFGSAGKPARLAAVTGLFRERPGGRVRILRTIPPREPSLTVRKMRTLRLGRSRNGPVTATRRHGFPELPKHCRNANTNLRRSCTTALSRP